MAKHDPGPSGPAIAIRASYKTTAIILLDPDRTRNAWASASGADLAASSATAMKAVAATARERGISRLDVTVKGHGPGREAALRALMESGPEIASIRDLTPIPHNGCRPRRPRPERRRS